MDSEDRFILIITGMIFGLLLMIIGAGVVDDVLTSNPKPDMSKCELVTSGDGHNAWYTCPYSMGV